MTFFMRVVSWGGVGKNPKREQPVHGHARYCAHSRSSICWLRAANCGFITMSGSSRSRNPTTCPSSWFQAIPAPPPARLRLNGGTMKLIPYHQDDKDGSREYRSPDGTWRVVRTPRDNGRRNDRSRWEVHDRHEDRVGGWHHHAAFERRRDALVFLDTTAAAPGSENVTTVPPKRPKTPELSQEPSQSSPRRTGEGADHARPRRNPLPGHPVVGCAACSCTIRGRSPPSTSPTWPGRELRCSRRPAAGSRGAARRCPARGSGSPGSAARGRSRPGSPARTRTC